MRRRVVLAYVFGFCLSVLLLALLALWASMSTEAAAGAAAGGTPAETQVVVQLDKMPLEAEPQKQQPEKKAGQPLETRGPSKTPRAGAVDRNEEKPAEPAETVKPAPAQPPDMTVAAKTPVPAGDIPQKPEKNEPEKQATPEPKKKEAEAEPPPKPPEPKKQDKEPPARSVNKLAQAQGADRGAVPPIIHLGDTKNLWTRYPRLEVAWLLERNPDGGDTAPGVICEIFLDSAGRLCWEDLRTRETRGDFIFTTMRHDRRARILVADPTQMKIWKHLPEIRQRFQLKAEDLGRLTWGCYRHNAEVSLLRPVEQAFLLKQSRGELKFDPDRGDVLAVEWGRDETGRPRIDQARFQPQQGEPVNLLGS